MKKTSEASKLKVQWIWMELKNPVMRRKSKNIIKLQKAMTASSTIDLIGIEKRNNVEVASKKSPTMKEKEPERKEIDKEWTIVIRKDQTHGEGNSIIRLI